MTFSINTNVASLLALQNLNATQTDLSDAQNRINTGKKVGSAKDNGAVWAIAKNEAAQASALDAVTSSLNNAKSVLDTTSAAGDQLIDILTQMKQKALAASDATIDDNSRAQYASEFAKLAQSYANTIASASFHGVNLIDGQPPTQAGATVKALGSADGKITVSSAHADLSVAALFAGLKAFTAAPNTNPTGPNNADSVTATASAWTGATGAADAAADMAQIDTIMDTVTAAMSAFGVDTKAMDNQITTVAKLQDSLNAGVSNLVDANIAQESAKLQALQTKQQLGVQALSIANQAPTILLSLFK